ncbi:nuclear migration protein [Cordyceps javanica]|uniref:Nuclear migration protein n=1 Tax=Cordyceps javanica TaxID=43265 RepID=A0A545ULL7_9HYPO|nr:nuclear migration protein [Cordyceps javanica]TQW01814.1 nuclear migration protein [Cordyceps javanica]
MAEWETENEHGANLKTREATRRSSSRSSKSRRRSKTPPNRAISPALADKTAKRTSRDTTMDESISILDPRRFTPTLHANLVSEILTLRRDQEDKTKLIESLETSLFSTKEENESLQANFTSLGKESRSLQRQLSLLEGGTSSALGELARERDDAVESITETKKRLDAAQKKIRSLEDDSQRVHEQWAKDKDDWEDEKRRYERKIHVSETRLKTILDEVAAYQTSQANGDELEDELEDAQKDNDGASIRTLSMTGSLRYSLVLSPGPANINGASLADELNLDDDDSDVAATESVFSSPRHKRTISRDTAPLGKLHRRDLSLESLSRPGSAARSRLFFNPNVLGILQGDDEDQPPTPAQPTSYKDTGVQFSPPPSPRILPTRKPEAENVARIVNEIEANQRRKRVQLGSWSGKPPGVEDAQQRPMISVAAQTVETPLSPPRTPTMVFEPVTPPPETVESSMVSSATQTDKQPQLPLLNLVPPLTPPLPAMPIPSISVQPPTSRPTTPRSPMLPPYMKNFGCQVNISFKAPMVEAAVQTEGIQVDKRLATLPLHLQPSTISSRPTSPSKDGVDREKNFTPVPGNLPPRNPRRLASKTAADWQSSPVSMVGDDDDILDSYLRNDDADSIGLRASRRHGGLFSGFESQSSDEAEEFGEADVSDSEYRTALSAPRHHSGTSRPGKRNSFGAMTASLEGAASKHAACGSAKLFGTDIYGTSGRSDGDVGSRSHRRKLSKPLERSAASATGSSRSSDIRKHAMIQGSIASQQTRSRSPSLPDGRNPPFPIPLRDSSKRLSSSFMGSPSEDYSPTRAESSYRRGSSRGSYYGGSVRRVRSATAMPRHHRYRRHGSRSPPPLSVSTEAPESPSLPPLPRNDITTPRGKELSSSSYRRHRHELSTNTDNTLNTDPLSSHSSSHATGVVDAIAQTMVGEWMFKYVRRRKSFSVPDSSGKDDTGNDRHKRWVWLAPYERSILWSSKQPSSGSALMGKTGRKLTIQSVLDVKDDNPVPKGAQSIFNRSILILTPQRALKFTASSSERHYLWLTALSFLAHSSQAVPENLSAPQPQVVKQPHQQQAPEFEPQQTKIRRHGIRDSIRLAKNKTTYGSRAGPSSVPSIPSNPDSRMGEVSSSRPPPSTGAASVNHNREASHDTAEPPMIQRYNDRSQTSSHGRKRSNTGGQQHIPPPLSFRGFSGPLGGQHDNAHSTTTNTPASSDMFQSQASSNTTWGGSQRTSEASNRPGNFFDAIGTVRMEAFISPLASSHSVHHSEQEELRHLARRRSKEHRRRHSRSRSRNRDSYSYYSRGGSARHGYDDYYGGSRTAGEEEFFRDDPFKGF